MSDRFKKALKNQEFIHEDVNSDIKPNQEPKTEIITRNKSIVHIEKNTLPTAKRVRTKHGRNITLPLYVEELTAIEETVKKLGQDQDISISIFIRQAILDQCKKILGKDDYNEILNNQMNTVKPKKD
jgi:hypothetical protein